MPNSAKPIFERIWSVTLYDWIGLLVLTAVAVWFVYRLRSRYLGDADPAACDHQLLSQLTELRGEGQLTEEEYRSIKGQIARKIEGSIRRQGDGG